MSEETTAAAEVTDQPDIVLTAEQAGIVQDLCGWLTGSDPRFADDDFVVLGGLAGTGKTTLIRFLYEELKDDMEIAVAAFTGKAAAVLRQKGLPGQTLHSLMYHVHTLPDGTLDWQRVGSLGVDLVIVDEASMLNDSLFEDLISFGTHILFVGDMGQLEPVGDDPQVMAEPDLVLEQIHRQAAKSPILKLAYQVRQNIMPYLGRTEHPDTPEEFLEVLPPLSVTEGIKGKAWMDDLLREADQVICGLNQTRLHLNKRCRELAHGCEFPVNHLTEGDRLICLRNNNHVGVYNGLIAHVLDVKNETRSTVKVDLQDEQGEIHKDVLVSREQLGQSKSPPYKRGLDRHLTYWDYGYAITCHKSQGSEWDSVVVIEEMAKWNQARWSYTGATRAAKRLWFMTPRAQENQQ